MLDLIPPHNNEAEQSVLGSIFLAKEAMETVREILQPDDFYKKAHERIYTAMTELYDNGEPFDLITVTAKLQDQKLLTEAGGVTYMTDLAKAVPTAANVEYYAQIVKEKAIQRQVIQRATAVVEEGYSTISATELVEKAEKLLADIGQDRLVGSYFTPMRDALMDVYDTIERLSQLKTEVTGIPSGYSDLDRMTRGFQRSDLIILAARPSVGKTAFALNVAQNAGLRADATVAIFSLEMSTSQLVQRMLSAEGNLDASRLKTGMLDEDDWMKLTMATGKMSRAPIYIDDTAGQSVTEIRRKCRKLKKSCGRLDLVIIDYLQLIGSSLKANRQEQVSEISRALKALAKELDVPVVALSQLSRSVEQRQDKRPMLSDLRESGSIEQDADIVAFLYRDDYYDKESENKNVVEVIISKQRNGPTGTVELAFLKEFNKFVSLDNRFRGEADGKRAAAG
ncbi:replicative DNA helicase [Brevibacillus agri]|uniref:replicative DNA helicase n=1 Tax=Brevibacillus agri TaxID=51101 RepID=UPI003D261B68